MLPVVLTLSADQVTAVVAAAGAPAPVPVPVVAPPVAPSAVPFQQHRLWDGVSGVRGDVWDDRIPYVWAHRGGDWVDAKGVQQGTAAFATFTMSTATPNTNVTFDLTALVQKWLDTGRNRGAYIWAGGTTSYAASVEGRLLADGTPDPLHPKLVVTTEAGTFDCPCICNARTTNQVNQSGSLDSPTGTQIGGGGDENALIQWDLSAVQGTKVATAPCTLHEVKFFGGSGTTTGHVYEVDTPDVAFPGDPAFGTPVPGIATGKTWSALAAHPAVLFHTGTDYQAAAWTNPYFGVPHMISKVARPETGTTALRTGYAAGDCGGGSEARNIHQGVIDTGLRLPKIINGVAVPQIIYAPKVLVPEVYARVELCLDDDYGDTVDSCKFPPGLQCAFGAWQPDGAKMFGGAWYPLTGNGGARGTGTVGYYAGTPGALGHWDRTHIGCNTADGNPTNDAFFKLQLYFYYLDQAGAYGDLIDLMLPGKVGACIPKKRYVNIELHGVMNTIRPMTQAEFDADVKGFGYASLPAMPTFNATTGFDSWNNGQANADGVWEVWVEGVLVYSRKNVRYIRNPWFLTWEAVSMDKWHGGTLPAPKDEHILHDRCAIATMYMGTGILPG